MSRICGHLEHTPPDLSAQTRESFGPRHRAKYSRLQPIIKSCFTSSRETSLGILNKVGLGFWTSDDGLISCLPWANFSTGLTMCSQCYQWILYNYECKLHTTVLHSEFAYRHCVNDNWSPCAYSRSLLCRSSTEWPYSHVWPGEGA